MDTVESYRIRAFQETLQSNPHAEHAFLESLKKEGTPIIEEVVGYNRFVWVTHVYVADRPLDNVALYETHLPFNEERAKLNHIEGTSIWYKTTIVPYDATVQYAFSLNDSLKPDCKDRPKTLQLDMFNQHPISSHQGLKLNQVATPEKRSTT